MIAINTLKSKRNVYDLHFPSFLCFSEIRSSLQVINNLRRSREENQSFTECIKHSRDVSTSYNHTNNTQATTSNQNVTVSKETKPEVSMPKFTQRKNKSKNKHIRKRVSDTDEG